jgi:exo-poly-alpha-galacturonosidase
MNKLSFITTILLLIGSPSFATVQTPVRPLVSPGTISATTATVIWDKPELYNKIKRYHLLLNGEEIGIATKCYFTFNGLKPSTSYNFSIKAEDDKGEFSSNSGLVRFSTHASGKVINVLDHGAKGDSATLNTKAIQKAIDACPKYGTVLIPKGVFLSGALYLKSFMTLQIDKGGVLKGSGDTDDYMPFYNNRFEGWEMKTYASLINAGVMNSKGGYTVEQISIKGGGTISGGGGPLGKAMIEKAGIRSRGRLICLMNCKDVEIQGLNITNSPCWTIHYIYSKGVSCHDLNIVSTARNGDGLDPDSSDDSYIFNCNFSTGDDCIAIKSGKNPNGYTIARPTNNVRITDCSFTRGHGISIGSEMSGGVSNVLVRDCKAGALLHGMQIKGTKDRGGYVKNVSVIDCQLQQITIFSAVNYNNDGQPAPVIPVFENYLFSNIDLTGAKGKEPVIDINGFKEPGHKLKNVTFSKILLPEQAVVSVKDAENVRFSDVTATSGEKPKYLTENSINVSY